MKSTDKKLNSVDTIEKINKSDYPGLYQSADTASIDSQRNYFFSLSAYLISLIIISAIPYLNLPINTNNFLLAFLFIISLTLMLWLIFKKSDELWYNGRAVAESVKTRTWRWMMKAEPYNSENDIENDRLFIQDLKKILEQNKELGETIGYETAIADPITNKMKEIRGLDYSERLHFYLDQRIINQSVWYKKQTISFRKKSRNWFIVLVCLHLIAIFFLLYQIMDITVSFPLELITVGAGVVISWIQAKKYRQLAMAYSLAAHEITLIKYESADVKDDGSLSEFVINSENAFSREHTQWIAKKSS